VDDDRAVLRGDRPEPREGNGRLGLTRLFGGRWGVALSGIALLLASPVLAPQLLAFPYQASSAIGPVWSERPIDRTGLDRVAARSRRLLAQSPIAGPDEQRPIFLTDGGWRWLWLANTSAGGFAFTRPITKAVVVNDADVRADRVRNGAAVGSERTLSGVLAHEFTHGVIRRRYGIFKSILAPQWLVEGYADHIAQESSLTAADVARLEENGGGHPALVYYRGRKKVEALLAANGNDVDALFD
jgi:hypothetical protein